MLLIVTGTICPDNNVPQLVLKNRDERLVQYNKSIEKLLNSKKVKKVIFCDNSNQHIDITKLNKLAKLTSKEFEYITFNGDIDRIIDQGKGYGEGEIINHILEKSTIIRDEDYFFKITGRLFVDNIDKIIEKVDKEYSYFNKTSISHNCNSIDTRFYGVRICDYNKYLRYAYKKVSDRQGKYLEHVFFDIVKNSDMSRRNIPLFPRIIGQSGSMGSFYSKNKTKDKLKDFVSKANMFAVR